MKKRSIEIFGKASNKTIKKIEPQEHHLELTLLVFLSNEDLPIASSCSGEGICEKCVINGSILSCQKTVQEFINSEESLRITVDYL